MKFVVDNQLIIISGEEDFVVSHLSSFRYIEADEDALETSFQALEIANATFVEMKGPVGKACSSFASLKSAKSSIEGGNPEGWGQLIDIREKHDRFGLGYVPSAAKGARVPTKDNTRSIQEVFLSTRFIHGDQVNAIEDSTANEDEPSTNLHYREERIFVVVIEDLLAKGIKNAKNTILSRCSAGESTSILQYDRFRTLLPAAAEVKCVSGAGYFINVKAVSGAQHIEQFYSQVVQTHASTKNLPSSCTSRLSSVLCCFSQNEVAQISTPIFFVIAAYDSWQIRNILAPGVVDLHGTWRNCKLNIKDCYIRK
ncbi:pectin acetylesterase 8-like [Lathyrus oleraceus]|uniref:pectin acetylesterase 8-like n=1 Tax=Pisum sativum TaxID=3888 RepID=UPI0021CF5D84|nr:pectin acetylesterase 8-like [Pisum sativum]